VRLKVIKFEYTLIFAKRLRSPLKSLIISWSFLPNYLVGKAVKQSLKLVVLRTLLLLLK